MDWFSWVQKREIDLIIGIQNSFSNHEEFLGLVSTLFGSTFIYVFIVPLLAAVNTRLYHKALISCIISDFFNLVLKWILSGDRPYWWIHETKEYTSLTRPTLYQNERTCETSPGSPSGHLMIAASFLFVMLIAAEKLIVLKTVRYRRPFRYVARTVFVWILVVIAVSRMYFATHFLHQCIFGALLGASVSETIMFTNYIAKVQKMDKSKWFTAGCLMVSAVAVIFWLFKYMTGNPMASVHLAFKYCSDPLFPKPETTVIFSSIRTIAKVVGLFFAAPLIEASPPGLRLNYFKSIPAVLTLMAIQYQLILYTPKQYKLLIFYAYTFTVYSIFQYLFVAFIPKFCAQKVAKPKTN